MTIIELLELALNNPLILTFLTVWVVGWFLKNKTKINNKMIPLIITLLGALLGLFIIDMSVKGAVLGLLISSLQMGGYDLVKTLAEFVRFTFKSFTGAVNENQDINDDYDEDDDINPDAFL